MARKRRTNATTTAPATPQPPKSSKLKYLLLAGAVAVVAWMLYEPGNVWAHRDVVYSTPLQLSGQRCAKADSKPVKGCSPTACGRYVRDGLFTDDEVRGLVSLAERGMSLGGGSGGPTILDLHMGGVSKGEAFIDLYKVLELAEAELNSDETSSSGSGLFGSGDVELFSNVTQRIQAEVAAAFGSPKGLHLASPTFFSRMDGGVQPRTEHDEYWHLHIDTVAYGSFVYTGLLYLNTHNEDFEGGAFVFEDGGRVDGDKGSVVEPRPGRLLLFTSGAENPHRVERVTKGTRYALTVAFTCSETAGVRDFLGKMKDYVAKH